MTKIGIIGAGKENTTKIIELINERFSDFSNNIIVGDPVPTETDIINTMDATDATCNAVIILDSYYNNDNIPEYIETALEDELKPYITKKPKKRSRMSPLERKSQYGGKNGL